VEWDIATPKIEQLGPSPAANGMFGTRRYPAVARLILAGVGLLVANIVAATTAVAGDANAPEQPAGQQGGDTFSTNVAPPLNPSAPTKEGQDSAANGTAAGGQSPPAGSSASTAGSGRGGTLLVSGGAIAAAADAAVGQSTAPTQEITVTARRRRENVQDVPIPVTVLSGQQLETSGTNKVQQLQYQVPSTSIYLANPRQAAISIRGLGNNPANDGLVDSVGIYIDGVYLDRSAMASFGLFDLDQVEVLRGPQGTLFGKNTTAGAINITTNKPTFDWESGLEADFGTYDTAEYTGFVSGPIAGTWLAARLSFDIDNHTGYVQDIYGGSYNGLGRDAFRAQLLYQPDAQFSIRTIGEYGIERDDSGFSIMYSEGPSNPANSAFNTFAKWTVHAGVMPIINPDAFQTDANGPQLMRQSEGAFTTDAEWKTSAGYTLTSITGLRLWDFQPHNNNMDGIAPPASNGLPISQQDINNDKEVSQELRLASPIGGPIDYVAGFYYFWNQLLGDSQTWYGADYSTVFFGNPALNGAISNIFTNPTTNSVALFGQANWHITNRLTLTAGLRETFEQNSISINRPALIGGTPPLPITTLPYRGGDTIQNWNPSRLLSLSYKITPDVLGYVSLAQSSKAGGFNSPAVPGQSGTTFLPISTLVVYPETANDAEAGIKSSWFDNKLTLNGDAFYTRVTNYQANSYIQTTIGAVPVLQNVGAVITNGFEVEATARPFEGLSLSGYGSWDPAYYESFDNAPSAQGSISPTQNLSGSPVVGAPRWTGGISGTYTWPMGPNLVAYAYANYAYKSGQYGYIDNSPYSWIKPYGLADFRLGMIIRDRYEVAAWVQNAFDTPNFYSVATLAGGLGGYTAAPGVPRVAGITLRVRF
jgi:iron complex outermembrane recepter protein